MQSLDFISQNLAQVAPSATMAVTQLARELRQAGKDVISLSVGEPDFDTPDHILNAAIEALRQGKTRYTNVDGIADLKSAICAKFKRENGLAYTEDQINVSPGGKAVLYNAFLATLNVGDEVIIPTPCWVSYPEMVKLCGATPVLVTCDMQSGFKITPQQLNAKITPKTRWFILNSPGNPTGAAYSRAELKALSQILLDHPNVMVLTDDIYEHLVYDGFKFSTLAQVEPGLLDRVLTMNGVSKAYAMTGWRIGYAGGPKWVIEAMAKVMSQSTSNPSSISQWAAVEALNGPQDFLLSRNTAFQKRRNAIVAGLNATKGLSCATPQGAFYVYPSCMDVLGKTSPGGYKINSDLDFCQSLLEEALVATVPGTAFHGVGHFRVSYATDIKSLTRAYERIQTFCEACR